MFCTICQCDIDPTAPPSATETPRKKERQHGGFETGSKEASGPGDNDSQSSNVLPSIHSSRLVLPCGHGFHRCCILKWVHFGHNRCPNCNKQIEELTLKVPVACAEETSGKLEYEEKMIDSAKDQCIKSPDIGKESMHSEDTDVVKQGEIEEVKLRSTNTDEIYSSEPMHVNLDSSLWSVTSLAVQTTASPSAGLRGLSQTGWYNVRLTIVPPKLRKIESIKYVFHPAFSLNTLEIVSEPFDLVVKLCTKEVKVVVIVTSIPLKQKKRRAPSGGKQETGRKCFCFVHTVRKETSTRSYIDPFLNSLDTPTLYSTINPTTYFQSCLATYNRSPEYYKKTIIPPLRGDRRAKLREYNERGHRIRRANGMVDRNERDDGVDEGGGIGSFHERDRDICNIM